MNFNISEAWLSVQQIRQFWKFEIILQYECLRLQYKFFRKSQTQRFDSAKKLQFWSRPSNRLCRGILLKIMLLLFLLQRNFTLNSKGRLFTGKIRQIDILHFLTFLTVTQLILIIDFKAPNSDFCTVSKCY